MTPIVRALSDDVILMSGSHDSPEAGMCAMEAVAFVAGEPHSDHPQCASEVIGSFLRQWNDAMPDDAMRTRLLKPLVPKLVDSRSTPAVEEYRAFLCFDWLIRIYTPAWLDLVPSCATHASSLRALSPVRDMESARAAEPVASAARSAAWSAAGSAARSAAWSAAGSAARSAAWSAAERALTPTRDQVQLLALDLVERMVAVTPDTLPAGWVPPSQQDAESVA